MSGIENLTSGFSGLGSVLFELLVWALLLGVVAGAIYISARMGLFTNRPYKVNVYAPRINGEVELIKAKGRFLKNGKFEIWYGVNQTDSTEAPKEEYFNINKEISFVREDRDSYYPTIIYIDNTKIIAEPTNSNAAKIAAFQVMYEQAQRFSKPNKWAQMLDKMAFAAAAVMLFVAIIYGLGDLGKKFESVSNSLNNVASKFDNIDKITFKQTTTQTAAPQEQQKKNDILGIPLGFSLAGG